VSGGHGSRAGVCGRCGVSGPLAAPATDERPDLCQRCYWREAQPRRVCGRCGRVRQIVRRARDGQPDLCASCVPAPCGVCGYCGHEGRIVRKASGGRPALGRCCYRMPVAICTDCGREKPCFHAHSVDPVCEYCVSVRRAQVCLDCGVRRPANRRVEGGVLCQSCDLKRGGTTAVCRGCGVVEPLIRALCAACRLRSRIDELANDTDPATALRLAPWLRDLAAAENPVSTLRWFYTPGFRVTRRLLAGEIPVSHEGLDAAAAEAPNPVAFVRAALVDSGVLEPRDESSATFARWHAREVLRIEAGPGRAHVRVYATWHVAHQLARRVQRRGGISYASLKYARSLVSEAIRIVLWLHEQQLGLADLRQDLVDEWISVGGTMRRRVRLFLAWLERANVTGPLEVAWDDQLATRPAIGDEERFKILRRLFHDRELDLRDRFAGSVLLLYGQPLTRIAALRTTAVRTESGDEVTLELGRPDQAARAARRARPRSALSAGPAPRGR
jgi:hypothetical protein